MRKTIIMSALCVLLACLVFTSAPQPADSQQAPDNKPNIVWIMTDDQDYRSIGRMPAVQRLLVQQGTTFTNTFATTPTCCPSRTTWLRGQYADNHTVRTNFSPEGSYFKAQEAGVEDSTFATWLDDAGYVTALGGKYLNLYGTTDEAPKVPPGWDRWWGYAKGMSSPFGYTVNENGTERRFERNKLSDPDYLALRGEQFVNSRPADGPPFFLALTPFTPHHPYFHAERHAGLFGNLKAPRFPNFNEADVSDKPAHIRSRAAYTPEQDAEFDEKYRDRMRGLRGVDEMVERTVRAVERQGELDNTYFVFTSDNGYLLGGHRWEGKAVPYDPSVRVPFVVRGPGIPAGERRNEMIANTDWAPTIAGFAGVPTPDFVDGRDVGDLFDADPPAWRDKILLEYFGPYLDYGAVRTADGKLYAEYGTGEKEYYDLKQDPYQLTSLDGQKPEEEAALAKQLAALKDCAGQTCREAENP